MESLHFKAGVYSKTAGETESPGDSRTVKVTVTGEPGCKPRSVHSRHCILLMKRHGGALNVPKVREGGVGGTVTLPLDTNFVV